MCFSSTHVVDLSWLEILESWPNGRNSHKRHHMRQANHRSTFDPLDLLLGARTLLGARSYILGATSYKKLLVTKGIDTRSKDGTGGSWPYYIWYTGPYSEIRFFERSGSNWKCDSSLSALGALLLLLTGQRSARKNHCQDYDYGTLDGWFILTKH